MKIKQIFQLISLIGITACSGTSNFPVEKPTCKPRLQLQIGTNKGGIIENTDFGTTPDIPVDGFSGATKVGGNIGAHVLIPLERNAFETGIDYMYNGQTFTYNDPANEFSGKRAIGTSQFMIPLSFNLGLFRLTPEKPLFYLKLGFVMQYNLLNTTDSGQNLPAYSYRHWSNGVTLGLSTVPVQLNNGASLGIYLDIYRGGKIYNDFYNNDTYEMPGSGFMKIGIIYQFK
jgi:hypothetical protein